MKATELLHEKFILDDWVVEMVIWRVPDPIEGSQHDYKYRLYCGLAGQCRIRYDTERGKGDHKHIGDKEVPYIFIDFETLIADFRSDVQAVMKGDL